MGEPGMLSKYERLKILGRGSYGKATLVKHVQSGGLFVLKEIDVSQMSEKEKQLNNNEATVLAMLSHENIVQYTESFVLVDLLCIVMQYAGGGDLSCEIKRNARTPFEQSRILRWLSQMCLALAHIHSHNVLHRDLKPQNIFLTEHQDIKIGDFGISRIMSNSHDFAHTAIGTPFYFSPELCEGRSYDTKSDIWSLGCVAYELMTRRRPFQSADIRSLVVSICTTKPPAISEPYDRELHAIVFLCLDKKSSNRPSAQQLLSSEPIQHACAPAGGNADLQAPDGAARATRGPKPKVPPIVTFSAPPPPAAKARVDARVASQQQLVREFTQRQQAAAANRARVQGTAVGNLRMLPVVHGQSLQPVPERGLLVNKPERVTDEFSVGESPTSDRVIVAVDADVPKRQPGENVWCRKREELAAAQQLSRDLAELLPVVDGSDSGGSDEHMDIVARPNAALVAEDEDLTYRGGAYRRAATGAPAGGGVWAGVIAADVPIAIPADFDSTRTVCRPSTDEETEAMQESILGQQLVQTEYQGGGMETLLHSSPVNDSRSESRLEEDLAYSVWRRRKEAAAGAPAGGGVWAGVIAADVPIAIPADFDSTRTVCRPSTDEETEAMQESILGQQLADTSASVADRPNSHPRGRDRDIDVGALLPAAIPVNRSRFQRLSAAVASDLGLETSFVADGRSAGSPRHYNRPGRAGSAVQAVDAKRPSESRHVHDYACALRLMLEERLGPATLQQACDILHPQLTASAAALDPHVKSAILDLLGWSHGHLLPTIVDLVMSEKEVVEEH